MTFKLTVRSDVWDATKFLPKAQELFAVDTNVWFWVTYPKSAKASQQSKAYSSFVGNALRQRASLGFTAISLVELANVVERAEFEEFKRFVSGVTEVKEFRNHPHGNRAAVIREIEAAVQQTQEMGVQVDVHLDNQMGNEFLATLKKCEAGSYDILLVEAFRKSGFLYWLSDDADLCCVPGIKVITANPRALKAARQAGRLRTR